MESTLTVASTPSLLNPSVGVMLTFLFWRSWAARELDEAWKCGMRTRMESQGKWKRKNILA